MPGRLQTTSDRAVLVMLGELVALGPSGASGVYYDENGCLMSGSAQISDPAYADRYITESRELLASVST